jgi:hypothetical protein
MKDAALCVFPWDLQDEGLDTVLRFAAGSGLTSLFLASVYHAGWFVLPHNPRRKAYMTEDGAAYFHPDPARYAATPLKPKVARIARETDWFAAAAERLDAHGLGLTAWTVCFHNTPLGLEHPEHTVRNAFGDSYPHALCPASPAARAYVRGLALDLASRYRLRTIFLEAPNYRGRRHGHHHERDGTPFPALEAALMDVSFSEHDLAAAGAAGIDGERLRETVRGHLEAFFRSVPERPAGLPETMQQFMEACPALPEYLALQDRQVASLIAEIREDVRPFGTLLEGVENTAAYDVKLVGAYGKAPEEVAAIARQARDGKAPHQEVRVGLRLGFDPPESPGAIRSAAGARACARAAAENGADRLFFYNYSESPQGYLDFIRPALEGLIARPARGGRA